MKPVQFENETTEVRSNVIEIQDLRVDIAAKKAWLRSGTEPLKAVYLTPIEFRLLSLFVENPEVIFSRDELIKIIWGKDVYISKHTIDTHISSVRRKLGAVGQMIKAVVKKGYCFSIQCVD